MIPALPDSLAVQFRAAGKTVLFACETPDTFARFRAALAVVLLPTTAWATFEADEPLRCAFLPRAGDPPYARRVSSLTGAPLEVRLTLKDQPAEVQLLCSTVEIDPTGVLFTTNATDRHPHVWPAWGKVVCL